MSSFDQPDFDVKLQEAKLRALAEFAAGAGHEINNPVATIVGHVQMLLAKETDPERRQALITIGAQAYRIRDMIGDAMLFARPPEPRPGPLNLAAATRETIEKLAAEAVRADCTIEALLDDGGEIWADPVQFQVVLSNLLQNSLNACGGSAPATREGPAARRIVVTVSNPAPDTRDSAPVLTVADNGSGLSEIEREHLFDPFYSGRQAGRGLGFGLAKCWRIVTLHGGRIEVEAPSTGGATIRIFWPAPPRASG